VKFSIVITNHNYANFLAEAIESCLKQTLPAHEIIVVDDGSTDGSREFLGRYQDRPQIRLIHQENLGQEAALQRGIDAATGDWILGLDADDFYTPDCLESVSAAAEAGVSLIYFRAKIINAEGKELGVLPQPGTPLLSGDLAEKWMMQGQHHTFPPQSFNCFRADWVRAVPIHPAPTPSGRFGYLIDRRLQLEAVFRGKVIGLNRVLGAYRVHSSSATGVLAGNLAKFRAIVAVNDHLREQSAARLAQSGRRLHPGFQISVYYWPYRLMSFLMEPENHSCPGDRRLSLLLNCVRDDLATPHIPTLAGKLSRACKHVLIALAPRRIAWILYMSRPRYRIRRWLDNLR